MSEAPERIWAWWDDAYDVGLLNKHGDKRYTPDDAKEYVRADRIEELENILSSSPCEIAAHSNRLTEYMFHWEGRALDAETKLAKAVEERDEALNQLDSARHSIGVLEKRVKTFCDGWGIADKGRIEAEAKLAKAIEIIEAYEEDEGYIPRRVSKIYDELKGEK